MAHKAVFLDRDNTLIEDPGYINDPSQVVLLPSTADALRKLRQMGYKLVVVSNQSAVARGIVSEQVLEQIHQRLRELLAEENTGLDAIYYCPFHPDGVIPKYRRESDLRKPRPGMLFKAKDDIGIDLENSWLIGDAYRDIAAGKAAGCKTILIKTEKSAIDRNPGEPEAYFEAVNLLEAVNIIKRHELLESQKLQTITPNPEKPMEQTTIEAVEPAKIAPAQTITQNAIANEEHTEPVEQHVQIGNGDLTQTQLLTEIRNIVKAMNRDTMFSEFSIMKFLAGILQMVVPFCLLLALWYKMSPTGTDSAVFTCLGFAVVLQLMALTFYIMNSKR